MKKTFLLFGIAVMLSSCSRYYVNTLESSNTTKIDSTGVFKFENDSLAITYNFYGENAPVSIEFYNKLNEPIYVNWQQSALITGNRATSYAGEQLTFNAQVSGSSLKDHVFQNYSTQESNISGSAVLPSQISFIPPKSAILKVPLQLSPVDYKAIPEHLYKKTTIARSDGSAASAKEAYFNQQNSPLNFKSYLTMYTQNGNTIKNFTTQQEFYISTLTKSTLSPKIMMQLNNKPGNIFYYAETTGYGKTMEGVGIGVLFIGTSAASAALSKNENYNRRRND